MHSVLLNSQNQKVAENINKTAAYNAHIVYRAQKTGVFTILATTQANVQTGPYRFILTEKERSTGPKTPQLGNSTILPNADKLAMFDPYHKWLGIPKEQRPPTLFISTSRHLPRRNRRLEVIDEAAIRQTAHIRTYQIGPQAKECTKVLNEIAQAADFASEPGQTQGVRRLPGQERRPPTKRIPRPSRSPPRRFRHPRSPIWKRIRR